MPDIQFFISYFDSSLRMAVPLIFAALGGLVCEKSGITNIALEGKMLMGAFCAAAFTYLTGSQIIGFFCGGLFGLLFAVIFGYLVINIKANQIVTGVASTILATGLIPFFSLYFFDNSSSTPHFNQNDNLLYFPIIIAITSALLIWWLLKNSVLGLWIKLSGENPSALDSEGINVMKIRWISVLSAGFFSGLGGACLSVFLTSGYIRNMSSGRGFMALAALIIGGWHPLKTFGACLIFGFFESLSINLQTFTSEMKLSVQNKQPFFNFLFSSQFIQILPYILTLIFIGIFFTKSNPPKYLGQPYEKG